jgi:hypothetical protein
MKLYVTKQLDFGTQIYTQKYTKNYCLFLIKFSFHAYKFINFHAYL